MVPGFRWLFLLCMSSSRIPGPRRLHLPSSSSTAAALTQRRWVRRFVLTPNIPSNPFHEGALNFGTACFAFATTCKVACLPLTDPTPLRADGDFYTRAFDGSVALPIAGYDYGGGWAPPPTGLAPAGTSTSLAAAPLPSFFRTRYAQNPSIQLSVAFEPTRSERVRDMVGSTWSAAVHLAGDPTPQ